MSTILHPAMTAPEVELYKSFVSCSEQYVEFGTGGSTAIAASLVKGTITSVDSSKDWLDRVGKFLAENRGQTESGPIVDLVHVDIGPTKEWGYPSDDGRRSEWTNYHTEIWSNRSSWFADLYMVDGRFRVACFMQILLRCQNDALIMLHDFAARPYYWVVKQVAREVARAENLSVFQPLPYRNRPRIESILQEYALNPA